jgi:uncharacterized OB-fold protein
VTQSEFLPTPSEATRPYWEGTRERRLLLQWCPSCQRHVHHPREACPGCLGQDLQWVESAGTGTVHAASVHHRPFEAMSAEDCPYVVAFVDLDEGVRFLSNVVDADPGTVRAGDRVELTWRAVADGYHLPVFRPVASP